MSFFLIIQRKTNLAKQFLVKVIFIGAVMKQETDIIVFGGNFTENWITGKINLNPARETS